MQPEQDDLELFQRGNFVRMDPPRHRKLRTLVSQAFTPRVVAGLEPRVAELTTQLLDQVGERFDLIDALAYPLPVVVIAELLGIPPSDQGLFREWADVLLSQEVDPDQPVAEVSEQALNAVAPTMRQMMINREGWCHLSRLGEFQRPLVWVTNPRPHRRGCLPVAAQPGRVLLGTPRASRASGRAAASLRCGRCFQAAFIGEPGLAEPSPASVSKHSTWTPR